MREVLERRKLTRITENNHVHSDTARRGRLDVTATHRDNRGPDGTQRSHEPAITAGSGVYDITVT